MESWCKFWFWFWSEDTVEILRDLLNRNSKRIVSKKRCLSPKC